MNLVIVESPAKAKTINEYLGKDYKVLASYGHIRDLPKSKIGINMESFEPEYVIPTKSRKNANLLKKEATKSSKIILATDEDREGEAIAWHILKALDLDKKGKEKPATQRIVFHEITKEAILEALKNPRELDQDLVDAQQGRRILDRLVGYNLSPLLWKKIRRGLSAGRVQSIAVRLVVDREREIEKFKPDEYWEIFADLEKSDSKNSAFLAELSKKDGKNIEIKDATAAKKVEDELKKASFKITDVIIRDKKQVPPPPFITSTLQQESARKLYFTAKKTMAIAQKLYEGKVLPKIGSTGLITYMRTDSLNLSEKAISESRELIEREFGKDFLPDTPRRYKKKVRGAQEAHEAIRPTSIFRKPDDLKDILEPDELKLYSLIWKRTIASQMKEKVLELTGVDIGAGDYSLRAKGLKIKFPGFSKVYADHKTSMSNTEERLLPDLKKGDNCNLRKLTTEQKFTLPPARYSEASLIKALEENGIGRPSTYAPTLSTIKDRGYVRLENRYFIPEKIGLIVNDLLVDNFPELVNIKFTAVMEKEFDHIAEGKLNWKEPIKQLWHLIENQVKMAEDSIEKMNLDEPTDEVCEKCGKPMVIKEGRFGKFMACTGFPDCKSTRTINEKVAMKCPKCDGDVVARKTKRGRTFFGCANYPSCDFATWKLPKQGKDS